MKKKRKKLDAVQMASLLICLFGVLICLYPMYYVFIMSISDPIESATGVYFLPKKIFLGGYRILLKDPELWRGLGNTVLYCAVTTLGMLFVTFLAAYSLSRPKLKGRRLVVIYLLVPMYFGGGLIPGYLNMVKLGLYNTRLALMLPAFCGISYIILVTTYLRSQPRDLEEAAFVDGAGHWTVMSRIALPLAKPVLAVISIYQIVGQWNSWFGAMVYLTDYTKHPVQLYLRRILVQNTNLIKELASRGITPEEAENVMMRSMSSRQLKYAVIMIVTLPIVCVYPMFQKHFVKGVMLGSLKG